VSLLPAELRTELESALVRLDMRLIPDLIRQVGEFDPELGGSMASLADKLAYTPILHAIAARKTVAHEGQL
jgi:hypothetical protein